MAAASAPAKPEAPTTQARASGSPDRCCERVVAPGSTLLTQRPPGLVRDRVPDLLAPFRHLGIGEGPLGRPELEPQRHGLAALLELLTAIDVEHAHRAQLVAAGAGDRVDHRLRLHGLVHNHRDVLYHGG